MNDCSNVFRANRQITYRFRQAIDRSPLSRAACVPLVLLVALSTCHPAQAADRGDLDIPPRERILDTLHPTHPRLLVPAERFAQLREEIGEDEMLARWYRTLKQQADRLLDEPVSEYIIPDGKRLLGTSRRVKRRVYLLSLMALLEDEPQYVDRAWRELEAVAQFKDWNSSHFLDTAEMTHAVAIGYDWLFDRWTPEQREVLREAILTLGLEPGLKAYRGEARFGWWRRCHHNWNQVCNGGLTIGALAIADRHPEVAAEIIDHAVHSLPLAMRHYAPDGAWSEGPGYWHYATEYNVAMLAAMETALGTDFGLSTIPGFDNAGQFPLHFGGPTGLCFNYADGHPKRIPAWMLFPLSRWFDRPEYAAYQISHARPLPQDLLLFDPSGRDFDLDTLPRDFRFRGCDVAFMRSAWDDPNALFVGLKAGSNAVNHSHLDLGSFVLEALGERWIVDLGSDNYNLPSYFGGKRWTYYRLRAESHNTLVINPDAGPDQNPEARTQITQFNSGGPSPGAVLDLTPAYADNATRVQRTFTMPDRQTVVLRDEITCPEPAEIWSFFTTPAEVALSNDARIATLTMGQKRLDVTLQSPGDARFEILAAAPLPSSPNPPGQKSNDRVRKLGVHLDDATDTTIEICFEPRTG